MFSWRLIADLVSFLYDAVLFYAQTPDGAARLAQIEVDWAGLQGAHAEQQAQENQSQNTVDGDTVPGVYHSDGSPVYRRGRKPADVS